MRGILGVKAGLAVFQLICVLSMWAAPAYASNAPEVDTGFRLLYELRFEQARAQFAVWQQSHPDDPVGYASEAAAYLFEEFYRQDILTSEFFLDDDRLLGGIGGSPDEMLREAFFRANQRARDLAHTRLEKNPLDADALFALTISTGMLADYAALIEKRQLESLRYVREAEGQAKQLLKIAPDAADAYLALGAANYIIGCLPVYKRFFLWFGGITGDRRKGIEQMRMAATQGHYLKPFAKMLLALAALREKQPDLARALLHELVAEFPGQPLFARELALLSAPDSRNTSP
jgi:tetratricopeptide (TPR) repeat protein